MFPVLYDKDETVFASRGIGTLSDAISCDVTEERNGAYELKMVYAVGGLHYNDIKVGAFIKAKANEVSASLQIFRIYDIEKDLGNKITVMAEHISYALNGFPIPAGVFSNMTLEEAYETASETSGDLFPASSGIRPSSFSFKTVSSSGASQHFVGSRYNFEIKKPCGIRSLLGGEDGHFLDKCHGEYEFDNFTVKLHEKRGSDKGVKIIYGKNLVDFSLENDDNNCYSHILPYAVTYADVTVNGETEQQEVIVYSKMGSSSYGEPELIALSSPDHNNESTILKVKPVDLSDQFAEGANITWDKVHDKALSFISKRLTELCKITESIDVTYQPFGRGYGTEDFVTVEEVGICDDVTVIFPRLGISKILRVNKTVYNVLLEQYKSIEIGTPKGNFSDTVKNEIVN